jgi:hypothetical protein
MNCGGKIMLKGKVAIVTGEILSVDGAARS